MSAELDTNDNYDDKLNFLAYRIRKLYDHEQKEVIELIDSFIPIPRKNTDPPTDLRKLSNKQISEVQNMVQSFDHGNPDGDDDSDDDSDDDDSDDDDSDDDDSDDDDDDY